MYRRAVGALAGFAALAGCLKEKVPFCDNGALCPEPLVCTERAEPPYCGRMDQVETCRNMPDETPCELDGAVTGYCSANICTPCDTNNAACVYEGWVAMQPPVRVDLFAIAVVGPRELYAVGKGRTFVHWHDPDGKGGSESWNSGLVPGAGDLRSVNVVSSTEVYTHFAADLYRFDGMSRSQNPPTSPAATGSFVLSVWAAGSGDVFTSHANGYVGHYSAGSWTVYTPAPRTPPNLPGPAALRSGLWGTSSTNVFAVGNQGLVLHWTGSWSQETTTNHSLSRVFGSGPSDVYVVGRTNTGSTPTMDGVWTDHSASLPIAIRMGPTTSPLQGVWTNGQHVFTVADFGQIHPFDGWCTGAVGNNALQHHHPLEWCWWERF